MDYCFALVCLWLLFDLLCYWFCWWLLLLAVAVVFCFCLFVFQWFCGLVGFVFGVWLVDLVFC